MNTLTDHIDPRLTATLRASAAYEETERIARDVRTANELRRVKSEFIALEDAVGAQSPEHQLMFYRKLLKEVNGAS